MIALYFPDHVDEIYDQMVKDYWAIKDDWAKSYDKNGVPFRIGVSGEGRGYSSTVEISTWMNPPYLKLDSSISGDGFVSLYMRIK